MGKSIYQKLGDNIRAIRTKQNMSQGAVARALGLDKSYISHVENGKKNPTLRTIEKIAKILQTTVNDLTK
ncbi:MAG TPA: helix-turn-helix transcriptional regulator [Candidatus Paceibacterota bacterium]